MVAELCDRVVVLYGGLVMEEASIFDIFEHPSHPYTLGLLASIPALDQDKNKRLLPIPGSPPDMTKPPVGCPFAPRCPSARVICGSELPQMTEVSKDHHSRCWLLSPEAPKEQNPFYIREVREMINTTMLEVKDLTKHFKAGRGQVVHAVDHVSFTLEKGKTLGLVGESGCGKSSCARTIIRIYDPTEGQILLDGQDITHMKQRELKPLRRKMQMIFQDPYASLNARMTVRDIIAEPLLAHGIVKTKEQSNEYVYPMLERVGLTKEHANRYAHEFSGGQRQRVGIARALVLQPELVICDEPISALDVSIQAQVINLLKDFQEERGVSYLFIAHDLSMVRYVSDDVGVMYLGQLVEVCESDEIYRNPLHPYTKGLLGSIPIANPRQAREKEKSSIEGDIPSPISPPAGCRFHTRCPFAKPVCSERAPELKDVGAGHMVACHLYQ